MQTRRGYGLVVGSVALLAAAGAAIGITRYMNCGACSDVPAPVQAATPAVTPVVAAPAGEAEAGAMDEDGDITVSFDDCPPPVQATILEKVGEGSLNEIELAPNGTYEVDADIGGKSVDFLISPTGEYLGLEEEDDDDED